MTTRIGSIPLMREVAKTKVLTEGEKWRCRSKVSPSVSLADSSLVRGSLGTPVMIHHTKTDL